VRLRARLQAGVVTAWLALAAALAAAMPPSDAALRCRAAMPRSDAAVRCRCGAAVPPPSKRTVLSPGHDIG